MISLGFGRCWSDRGSDEDDGDDDDDAEDDAGDGTDVDTMWRRIKLGSNGCGTNELSDVQRDAKTTKRSRLTIMLLPFVSRTRPHRWPQTRN